MTTSDRKRKRDSKDSLLQEDTLADEESYVSGLDEVTLEDQYFKVSLVKDKSKARKKSKKGARGQQWGGLKVDTLPGSGKDVFYQINRGTEWDNLKKYKHFVVQDKSFGIDDYVFIRHDNNVNHLADDGQGWVGKVLEVRARDQTAVFVRIFWLYWQAELPMGSQPYHGEQELIMSDFMQIIDAQTVDGLVTIKHLNEHNYEAKPVDGYYWRQNYYYLTKQLSPLRADDCTCKKPHNPDTLLVYCDHCNHWQHELCIRDEVLRQKWDVLQKTTPNGVNGDGATDIPTPNSDTIAVTPSRSVSASARKKGGRKSLSKSARKSLANAAPTNPWDGILEGILERDEQSLKKRDDKPGTKEDAGKITGKVVVTDKRDTSGNRELLDARCLHCSALLVPASHDDDSDEGKGAGEEDELGDKIEVAT